MKDILNYQKRHPSKCWRCEWGRSVETKLLNKGWCGCGYAYDNNLAESNELLSGIECEEQTTGWIKHDYPCITFPQDIYGCFSNFQPIVQRVTECKYFKERK